MKYRIIQVAPHRYYVQKRVLFFWVRFLKDYWSFLCYEDARNALLEHLTFKKQIFDGDKILKDYYERVAQNYCTNPFKDTVVPDMMHGPVKMKECVLEGKK